MFSRARAPNDALLPGAKGNAVLPHPSKNAKNFGIYAESNVGFSGTFLQEPFLRPFIFAGFPAGKVTEMARKKKKVPDKWVGGWQKLGDTPYAIIFCSAHLPWHRSGIPGRGFSSLVRPPKEISHNVPVSQTRQPEFVF